jgi:hypothetical protein
MTADNTPTGLPADIRLDGLGLVLREWTADQNGEWRLRNNPEGGPPRFVGPQDQDVLANACSRGSSARAGPAAVAASRALSGAAADSPAVRPWCEGAKERGHRRFGDGLAFEAGDAASAEA